MVSRRIEIRNAVSALVAALPGFSAAKVKNYKQDTVEKTPLASVYLNDLNSEPGSMRGGRDREQSINVSLFFDAPDAEAALSLLVDALESSVEAARLTIFQGAQVHMASAVFVHDATSLGQRVDAHITFLFTFSEIIS